MFELFVIKDLTWPSESRVVIKDDDGNDDETSEDLLGYTSFFIIGASSGISTVIITAFIRKRSKNR